MKNDITTEKPTCTKIIEAAIPLFAVKGFAAVTVKELADSAGVNIALISYYFGGKEKLYELVLERQFALLAKELEDISEQAITPVEKIRLFTQLMITINKKYPYLDRLICGEITNPSDCVDAIFKKETRSLHHFLTGWIRDAIAAGQFRSNLDPDCAALALAGITHHYFLTHHLSREMLPQRDDQAEYYMSQAIDIYLAGAQ